MRLKFAALLAGAFLFLTVPAFAGSVQFCTSAGTFSSVTVAGIVATGFQGTSTTTANTSTPMDCKLAGASETGLGIASDPQGEIGTSNFIQLDMSGFAGNSGTFTIESVQGGEGFNVLGSNGDGILGIVSLGTTMGGGTDNVTVNFTGFKFLDITATSGNVLLSSVEVAATPEPSTYLLMGTGLLMLGFFMRRKFASSSC